MSLVKIRLSPFAVSFHNPALKSKTHSADSNAVKTPTANSLNSPGKCQLCGNERLERFEIPGSSVLWKCEPCELFQYGQLVDEEAYAADYHFGYEKNRRQKIRTAHIRLNRIAELCHQKQPRILDVGCSVGATLEAAKQIDWSAVGVDVSQDAVDYCQGQGLDARKVNGTALPFEDESFDIVVNWHVVEHVPDVEQTLVEWNRVLKKGGLLVMETPDAASPKVRKLGAQYRKFWAPEHTYTFTFDNLSQFVQRAGFGVETASMTGPLMRMTPWFGSYCIAYQTYHKLRQMFGVQKAFQIFARKEDAAPAVRQAA